MNTFGTNAAFFTKGGKSGAYPVKKISEFEFIIERHKNWNECSIINILNQLEICSNLQLLSFLQGK